MFFPFARGELMDFRSGVVGHALEDVGEVGVWVDAVHLAADDEALEDAHVLGADFGPAEEPILAAHRDDAQGAFYLIGVQRDLGVRQEEHQRVFTSADVA